MRSLQAMQRRVPGAAGLAFACCLFWIALSFGFAHSASAQEAATDGPAPVVGILVLNQERIFAQSLYGQRIQQELEAASARLAAENRRIEAELTEEELALTELRATTEADAFRELADAFDTRVETIRAEQEAKARDLTSQADAAQAQFFERVAPILLDIVRERNAAVLLDSRSVLLSADRVDVTEPAIEAIDDTLGEGGPDPIISIDANGPSEGDETSAP